MTLGLPELPIAPHTPPPAPRRTRLLVAIALMVLVAGGAAVGRWVLANPPSAPPDAAGVARLDTLARAPAGTRIVVRVVNGSGVRGLARRATLYLREFGYDVVDYDSESNGRRSSTEIIVHTGHGDWASRVQRALGTGTVRERADSLRYLDLTVILGRDWQPPTEPLRP